MFFNFKNRHNDSADDNGIHNLFNLLDEYKMYVFMVVGLILFFVMIIIFFGKGENEEKIEYFLTLNGEEYITISQGEKYIEPGYTATNSKGKDITNDVIVKTNLNINRVDEYEIRYIIGDVTKKRIVNVVEDKIHIELESVNNSTTVYLNIGEEYIEPGYKAYSNYDDNLNDKVKIESNLDINKAGKYTITYRILENEEVLQSVERKVIVVDNATIKLSLNTNSYVNNSVNIKIEVIDDYFDYLILPNGNKVSVKNYSYKVSENGIYKFISYNKINGKNEQSIEVKNIDKTAPSGTCIVEQYSYGSNIKINVQDTSGIKKYIYNNKEYNTNNIKVNDNLKKASIIVYDNANNYRKIECTVTPKILIKEIKNDGVIVSVISEKINNEIAGYYFSYTSKRPNKEDGGYISTNKETIDVVRLPGTTYVWVEDIYGKISEPKTITLTNDVLFDNSTDEYTMLKTKNSNLEEFLQARGWSVSEMEKLMARSVRAAGIYTKEAAATAGVSLITVLAQKYKIRLPYESAGLYKKIGMNRKWGGYGYNDITFTYGYYGMDCTAFITWAYVNAGYEILSGMHPGYWGSYKRLEFSKENGEIGDILVTGREEGKPRHVRLIIGKTDTAFITAEATGSAGLVVRTHKYSSPSGYKIEKASNMKEYNKNTAYPTGF